MPRGAPAKAGTPRSEQRLQSRSNLGEVFFYALLILFAADTERGFGTRFQALDGDLLAAVVTGAEAAVVDLLDCLLDLVQERFFAATQTKREGLEVLARRQIHFVRQVVRVES